MWPFILYAHTYTLHETGRVVKYRNVGGGALEKEAADTLINISEEGVRNRTDTLSNLLLTYHVTYCLPHPSATY